MADAPKIERGEPVALVLGAGGARGFAQIGVIEALQARGLRIVAVAGSSSGALVGGVFAAGQLGVFRDWLLSMSRTDMLRLLDPVFGQPALFEGSRLMAALRERTGDLRIEELPIDFTAVAVDLARQREVWLREGDLWDAVRASIAIPGVFTPHRVHGRELVDGGLLAPLPITASRLSDAHRLIAVDMNSWPSNPPGRPAEPEPGNPALTGTTDFDEEPASPGDETPSHSRLLAWFEHRFHRHPAETAAALATAAGARPYSLVEVMARSLDTMQAQIARVQMALDPPELVIRIPRDACQFYEFWRARELIEVGRTEADKALDAAGY
ncbi:patatin-like phospholipase family protein [Novilysobacter erysipheiresistens]|uniref:Patatin-like phospholipase family protein n=1 Tax=Novilysobacter erysipheiresistens TaxID=1749332 RepID=A0ABU7YZG1_9GAMM